MDENEVIVIEDSPSSSPAQNFTNHYIYKETVNNLPEINENLPTTVERAAVWAKRTSNFIKNSMNVAFDTNNQAEKSLCNFKINTSTSYEVINLTTTNRNETQNILLDSNIQHIMQEQNIYNYKTYLPNDYNIPMRYNLQYYPNNYEYGFKPMDNTCYPVYESRNIPYCNQIAFNGSAIGNYSFKNILQTSVKIHENCVYNEQNVTRDNEPQTTYRVEQDYNMQYMPEFIDVNNLINYNYNENGTGNDVPSLSIRLNSNKNPQTTECETNSTTVLKNNKRYDKNSIPLFLKRNRCINYLNKMKNIYSNQDINGYDSDMQDCVFTSSKSDRNESNDDDSDVVYVGAYANDSVYPGNQPTYKLPSVEKCSKEVCETVTTDSTSGVDDSNDSQSRQGEDTSSKETKEKRKRKSTLTVPRRNPKRQVQIEKDYMKLLDDVLGESKKEVKTRKTKRINKYKGTEDNKKYDGLHWDLRQNYQKSLRQVSNCGAVYCPPSPLTKSHIRNWPATGMHERPEYNPVSGNIEQFDHMIRNLSNKFQEPHEIVDSNDRKQSETANDSKMDFSLLCHEMFHHVFAYCATVKSIEKDITKVENNEEKVDFLKDLSLMKTGSAISVLSSSDDSSFESCKNNPNKKTNTKDNYLKEFMHNSILLYCLTNNVEQEQVAKYIHSLRPHDVIQWSTEQFQLTN